MKELIHIVLRDCLSEKHYSSDEAKNWTKEIGDIIQTKLKGNGLLKQLWYNFTFVGSPPQQLIVTLADLQLERYKYVIQVVIGEQRGEGVR